ncbi:MAG: bile acid:sodium symporter [Enhygromyxa sp.]
MSGAVQLFGSALLVVSLMFAAGLQLRVADLLALRERPRVLGLAVLINIVAVPGITYALLAALALPAEVVLGLLLCIAAPGGPAAVLYVNTARADLPMTVGLTIVLPILGVFTTPLTLSLVPGLPDDLAMPVVPVLLSLIGFQLVPLALGMLLRARRPALAERLTPYAKTTANLTLAALVVVMTALEGQLILETPARVWLAMIGSGGAAIGLGYLAALPGRGSARAGAIVAISRNISVSLMLASTFFVDPRVNATVLIFGLIAFVGPLGLALAWRSGSGGGGAGARA